MRSIWEQLEARQRKAETNDGVLRHGVLARVALDGLLCRVSNDASAGGIHTARSQSGLSILM